MENDDYKLTPSGRLGGKVSVSNNRFLKEFDEMEDALEFVRDHSDSEQYWPSIWWISDHGNAWLIDLDGNEITSLVTT